MKKRENGYYVGLDIGTDSVGYAVTTTEYQLCKFKGEPMWGVHLFEGAQNSAERRSFRAARRRIDRKQQRVKLIQDMFASEIAKVDPAFYTRLRESALYRDECSSAFSLFADKDYTDADYHEQYPTIHHLIHELMSSTEAHDVRLVYLACSWLVAHRGHFLLDVDPQNTGALMDFAGLYRELVELMDEREWALPWNRNTDATALCDIMKTQLGVTKKQNLFCAEILGIKRLPKTQADIVPDPASVTKLLCGAKVKPADLFCDQIYGEEASIALGDDDETFAQAVSALGDDGLLLTKMKALYDCAMLQATLAGTSSISESKIAIYRKHKADLQYLKKFVKKYIPEKYNEIFREAGNIPNYTSYSYNTGDLSAKQIHDKFTKSKKSDFSEWLKKLVSKVTVTEEDQAAYQDMLLRLDAETFLPKQKNTDNRVIPYQLYFVELEQLLKNASSYLPWLSEKDTSGFSPMEKILSVFTFKIPYFVGPLNAHSSHGWIVKKAEGKIYPWNFEKMVDFDRCEDAFINKMTGACTYLYGAAVLPRYSLIYCRYTVLDAINNLTINGEKMPAAVKQEVYNKVFLPNPEYGLKQTARVTKSKIAGYLRANGYMGPKDELGGVDTAVGATMLPYFKFRRLMESGTLKEAQVDAIISRFAYTEDRKRRVAWLKENYPNLCAEDIKYLSRLSLGEFGRLSEELLTGISGTCCETGEYFESILDALWKTNDNLMQLLSEKYSFRSEIEKKNAEYYAEHPMGLNEQLDEMYISNGVKRPILRTLDVVDDVVSAMKMPPKKIFVEMARGASEKQKGKRTISRLQQLKKLYQETAADTRELEAQLEAMGDMADNKLQSDKLFLYYLQLGKCAYTGKPIELGNLSGDKYNLDHIYPRAFVKDDSVLNNLVLVCSTTNGSKSDTYPIDANIREKMSGFWYMLRENGLLTEEKYRRLTRATGFTSEERWAFINRQLVETRQSTKAVAQLLKSKYPDTEIVYVKAGLVSEFRQEANGLMVKVGVVPELRPEFDMVKSRAVNSLHHAKDAYLNIVVGNVYDNRFSKKWFRITDEYSIKVSTIFSRSLRRGEQTIWNPIDSMETVRKTMGKNCAHVTQYAFCRKGGLFDQMPKRARAGLIPLHKKVPTERYGGYNKPTASFYVLARYSEKKKRNIMFVPVELMEAEKFSSDSGFAVQHTQSVIEKIKGKPVSGVELLLNGRQLKIKTVLRLDGVDFTLDGKSGEGRQILVSSLAQLALSPEDARYIKRLESFSDKEKKNPRIVIDPAHDLISAEANIALYRTLMGKMGNWPFSRFPANQSATLKKGQTKFETLALNKQIACILGIVAILNGKASDLKSIGGAAKAGGDVTQLVLEQFWKLFRCPYCRSVCRRTAR